MTSDASRNENSKADVEQWLALRKEAALKIDPATAEVLWKYGQILDPYGIGDLSKEEWCVGRLYFARSPDSDIWVLFDDLPEQCRDALWEMHRKKLGFPAGLPLGLADAMERDEAGKMMKGIDALVDHLMGNAVQLYTAANVFSGKTCLSDSEIDEFIKSLTVPQLETLRKAAMHLVEDGGVHVG